MKEGLYSRFMFYFTLAMIAVIVVGGLILVFPSYSRGRELRRQELQLRAQIAEKKREIAQLAENQRRFKADPDFVESIARQNRRVFPGEIVFIFEE
ncbi:MAG: septum formation initiator family protein [Kiritimatiellae bacterium]|nr:septum formation initiator family protein [Kiritimatiellia bacterium]